LKQYSWLHFSCKEILFGRQKTPAEMLRQHQRSLQKAQREMDREKAKLDASEKKLIADIKKAAKANQMVCYRQNFSKFSEFH